MKILYAENCINRRSSENTISVMISTAEPRFVKPAMFLPLA